MNYKKLQKHTAKLKKIENGNIIKNYKSILILK